MLQLALAAAVAAATWTTSAPVVERAPRPTDLLAYPHDGQTAGVNPPGFCWTPSEAARGYRLEVRKSDESSRTVISTAALTSTVYPPVQKLDPGEYLWQVIYLDAGGKAVGASRTRRFRLPAGAPVLLMPDAGALKARLAKVRPRLFLAGGRLEQLRSRVRQGAAPSWERMRKAASAALDEKPYAEPEPYRPGVPSDQEWRRTYTPGKVGSAHVARTALAYIITGELKYLEGARRWMMTLAGWDPKGITSHGLKMPNSQIGNDEASMPMLDRMSLAWDWIGDKLTATERAAVLASMTERGNQVLRVLERQDFLSHPFNNHSGRAIAFLGNAGLAFLGDIPDAEKWLDYVLRSYLTSYPGWGGDEGGWSQGLSYWGFYVFGHANFIEALRQVTGTDIFRRPFYRHTGYLPLYFHPPYAPRGAFGDGGYHRPSEVEAILTDRLAGVFRDPVLKWQALGMLEMGEKNETPWREWSIEDVVAALREATPDALKPEPPTHLDGSRHLSDIGWVAMHSALGDAANDVWVLFKASRFGSYSHSHADQNTFQLNAYGRALAIDSGYYPYYGSPHDTLWTRQTKAHNGILVNGRGQPPFEWAAGGTIEKYERKGIVTLVRGQAAEAYNLPQSAEPKVEAFERTLAFVASKTRPVLVVHDYLRTAAPATFSWLLHALNQMEADTAQGVIRLRDGGARLAVRLASTVPFTFSQHTGFPVKPEIATNTAYVLGQESFPDQWHLTATTNAAVREINFFAVLAPYRAHETEPPIEPVQSGRSTGFRINLGRAGTVTSMPDFSDSKSGIEVAAPGR